MSVAWAQSTFATHDQLRIPSSIHTIRLFSYLANPAVGIAVIGEQATSLAPTTLNQTSQKATIFAKHFIFICI
jgi:hypothetical protein